VLPVKVLAGLPPIRQRLSFLNERFLVSALAKPNDLFVVKLDELHRIWNISNGRLSSSAELYLFCGVSPPLGVCACLRYTTVCRWA
jgi:hypothetical protein